MVISSRIHADAVVDIAFVFHADVLEKQWIGCAGMNRTFFTHYCYNGNGGLVELNCEHHFPFSKISHESYPSQVWFSLLGLREKVKRLMYLFNNHGIFT